MMNSGRLAGKTVFITGASRGIGQAIAEKCAKDKANIVIAAKTATPHPKLPGTIYTVAERVEKLGGKSLACVVDIRDEQQVQAAVEKAVKKFGGIDILVNNASAISLTGTENTTMKTYDLMHHINTRGTYMVTQKCLPYLRQSKSAHVLNISPPLSMRPIWFKNHVAYTMAKFGMSMCVLGMAEEFRDAKIAVNALWPKTSIATAAVDMLGGDDMMKQSRKPEVMSDAAYVIFNKDPGSFTGNFTVDEDILKSVGVTDFDSYAHVPGEKLLPDFFLDESEEHLEKIARDWAKPMKQKATTDGKSDAATNPESVLDDMKALITPDVLTDINKVFVFQLSGSYEGALFLDLKSGDAGKGDNIPSGNSVDATLKMSDADFVRMALGELNSTQAFMSGKLKIEGDMFAAMKLEKLMKKVQKSKL